MTELGGIIAGSDNRKVRRAEKGSDGNFHFDFRDVFEAVLRVCCRLVVPGSWRDELRDEREETGVI